MSDYATRRDAGIQSTLTAIDAATTPQCMTCGNPVPPYGSLDLFCTIACHHAAMTYPTDNPQYRRIRNPTIHDDIEPIQLDEARLSAAVPAPRFRRAHLNRPVSADALSMTSGAVWSMDVVSEAITRHSAAHHHLFDQDEHASHRREGRGGIALWVVCAVFVATTILLATTEAWPLAISAVVVTPVAAWFAWMSVGNARAAATACRICHPPHDTTR